MDLIYYFPFGYFYPIGSGAAAVAARHLAYFRSRGVRPRIVVLANATALPQRRAFERHYHWAGDVSVIDLQIYPEIQRLIEKWSFTSFLAGHAAIARTPRFREFFARPADAILCNYAFSTPLLDACAASTPRILETCDILSRPSVYPDVPPPALQHQLKTEFDLYNMYDLVIMLNEEEADLARRRSSARIEYVPRAVEIVADELTAPQTDGKYDLLFVGSQCPPNVDGIRWFYDAVFRPHLKGCGLSMALAGTVCRAADIQDPAVFNLGQVDDLDQVYRDARAVVVPLFHGTGISIKTLEAMGQGKAVVATPCGRRGLSDCEDCLISLPSDVEPAAAADTIAELCRSPEMLRHYGRRARDYAQRHFSAEAYGRRMDGLLSDVLAIQAQPAA